MADLSLPIMARAGTAEPKALLCWARQDLAPPFDLDWRSSPYDQMCAGPPVSDFGLCAHHLATIFPPEARTHAPRP
jgi:hypothetical protein